jgi:hypothetical protein
MKMVTAIAFKRWKKENPYHIWVYRGDGSKFVGHFKNKAHAIKYAGKQKLGKVTTASKTKKRRSSSGSYGFGLNFPKLRF